MIKWTTKELAVALNRTPQRVGQLRKLGIIKRLPGGGFDPFVAVPAFLKFIETCLAGTPVDVARTAKIQMDTALATLRYEKEKGELVSRLDVEREWARACLQVRDANLNLADRIAGPGAMQPQDVLHKMVDKEVRALLVGLSTPPIATQEETHGGHVSSRPVSGGPVERAVTGPGGSNGSGARRRIRSPQGQGAAAG